MINLNLIMKNKLILLILFLIASLSATSQIDTRTLKLIVKDLHRLDYLEEIHKADSLKITIFVQQLSLKDSIIENRTQQVQLCDSIQSAYALKTEGLHKEKQKLEEQVTAARSARNVFSGGFGIALILLLL